MSDSPSKRPIAGQASGSSPRASGLSQQRPVDKMPGPPGPLVLSQSNVNILQHEQAGLMGPPRSPLSRQRNLVNAPPPLVYPVSMNGTTTSRPQTPREPQMPGSHLLSPHRQSITEANLRNGIGDESMLFRSRPKRGVSTSSSASVSTNVSAVSSRNNTSKSRIRLATQIEHTDSTGAGRLGGRSRRPSLVSLQSFAEGVAHVARVRSPSLLGHSRASSQQASTAVSLVSSAANSPRRLAGRPDLTSSPSSAASSRRESLDLSRRLNLSGLHHEREQTARIDDVQGEQTPAARHWKWLETRQDQEPGDEQSSGEDDHLFGKTPHAYSTSTLGVTPRPSNMFAMSGMTSPLPQRSHRATSISSAASSQASSIPSWHEEAARERADSISFFDLELDHMSMASSNRSRLRSPVGMSDGEKSARHDNFRYTPGLSTSPKVSDTEEPYLDEDAPLGFDGEPDFNVFGEGDRLGLGTMHEGQLVVDLFASDITLPSPSAHSRVDSPGLADNLGGDFGGDFQLEIIRQLGYGSYAVVYLARQVLYDAPEDAAFATDDHSVRGTVYGKEFALKCLCKKNLSDDLLEVQKFEATLHRSLPAHPNIAALHRAFATPSWLFLVMEYCTGQDLFYWLEQARDTQDLGLASPALSSPTQKLKTYLHGSDMTGLDENGEDRTPPDPYLLASTANTTLLSRRRLRLISRMFQQMCNAVQACHDVGISHRDIKPENFIVTDDRGRHGYNDSAYISRVASLDGLAAVSERQASLGMESEAKVVVKITDWGLGTMEDECGDFDCGSKPYMAYECRNNLHPTYKPKGADVWSLGIVLLNLLYHRCPWQDPTTTDPDFAEYRQDPVTFFENRFEGIGKDVALYLADRVFCNDDRVSAGAFGHWATGLVRFMGEGHRHASASKATVLLQPSSSRSGLGPEIANTRGGSPSVDGTTRSQLVSWPATPDKTDLHAAKLPIDERASAGTIVDNEDSAQVADVDDTEDGSAERDALGETSANRARRRKRGARKSRHRLHAEVSTANTASPDSGAGRTSADERLDGMAAETEDLARLVSKTHRPNGSHRSASTAPASPSLSPVGDRTKRGGKIGFMDRMKGALMNGNPDLQAFAQRVKERDEGKGASAGNWSAPAKLGGPQHRSNYSHESSAISSFGSVASSESWASGQSWSSGAVDDDRGRSGGHWASSSNRRGRLEQSWRTQEVSPGSTRSSSAARSNQTPASSFGSHASSLSSAPTAFSRSSKPAQQHTAARANSAFNALEDVRETPSPLPARDLASISERSSAAASKTAAPAPAAALDKAPSDPIALRPAIVAVADALAQGGSSPAKSTHSAASTLKGRPPSIDDAPNSRKGFASMLKSIGAFNRTINSPATPSK
ncbi:uncharacterized protein L969DRAFT_96144 [Mixia osmundae IAM 14324]|uniref:non-specific serine/threonine protein kinase n=1 Tax=Mixia osmundae (strain CBS 9802 / IAM 14324 / JCM 22182 / KY 12970) TaxID=764103 RepID=G7EA60_MIXOS|nr:uncharacterized protein L969DRAFT_96144 [Mixia osmundae IAM 14324]KEI37618.1 hypothetical protein L969DRAFT_96144 [Mixia osmundae IAM 14324]GAA99720.1 hypothetical protein E5Q_06423 [Mixia osmundae IAM 14324]